MVTVTMQLPPLQPARSLPRILNVFELLRQHHSLWPRQWV